MYVCMYVCMHACMYVCMYAWVYVCMHVCIHTHNIPCTLRSWLVYAEAEVVLLCFQLVVMDESVAHLPTAVRALWPCRRAHTHAHTRTHTHAQTHTHSHTRTLARAVQMATRCYELLDSAGIRYSRGTLRDSTGTRGVLRSSRGTRGVLRSSRGTRGVLQRANEQQI